MKQYFLFLILILFMINPISAQLTDIQKQQIDSLFKEWNKPNHPGGSIGIMKDGKIIYSKAFGLASLEFLAPNSPGTMYNIASVSKQFTAMGIVLLQLQGKLNIEDDIRLYIPEMANYKDTITIRHMLQHTSGLRSFHALLNLAGWRGDDYRTNEDLYRFMKHQTELNFYPGNQYLYSNTGYMLAAKIIENITKEPFPHWMKNNVFAPLGMTNTYVEDVYNRVVPNNASSYYEIDNSEFLRAVEYWGYVGSGNVHSTTGDILIWLDNFSNPKKGWKKAFKLLQTTNNLNNGKKNNYALGIVIDRFFSYERIQHGGSVGGFRSFMCTVPEEKLSIVLLTNFSSSNCVQKVNQISKIILPKKESKTKELVTVKEDIKPIRLEPEELKKFESWYWNDIDNYSRRIYIKDDTLRYYRNETSESTLIPIDKNTFKMSGVPGTVKVYFDLKENGHKNMIVSLNGSGMVLSESYTPKNLTTEDLKHYTGNYFSPELETNYQIKIINDNLFLHHPRHGNKYLNILKEDVFECSWPIGLVKIKRSKEGKIDGMRISNGRVKNLWFKKIQ